MKKLIIFLVTITITFSQLIGVVGALSTEQRKLYNQNILYYDIETQACADASILPVDSPIGSDPSAPIYSSGLNAPFILEQWAIHTLKAIAQKKGANEADYVTKEHVIALVAFALGEGGDINNTSSVFNPLNTGLRALELIDGGAAVDGTQSFKSFDAGVEATARTMVGKNQNRLATVLSKPTSTAKDFMTALTYYQRYSGNFFWAAASLPPNQDSYYTQRLSLITTVRNNYADIASFVIGTPEKEQPAGIRDKSKLQFDGSSDIVSSDTPSVTTGCACSTEASTASALVGDNNRIQAFNFFLEKGVSAVKAAGIIGNFMQESGENLDPNASNGSHEGIAQWDRPNRWANLLEFAARPEFANKGPRSLIVQLEFAHQEAPMRTYLAENPSTPEEAAELFERIFERSGGSALDKRRTNAINVFNEMNGASLPDQASQSNCPTPTASGTTVVDGGYAFPVGAKNKSAINTFGGALNRLPCTGSCHHGSGTDVYAYDLGVTGYGPDRSENAPIFAITTGELRNVDYTRNGGQCNAFQLVGDDGYWYWYGHLRYDASVKNGQKVTAGQQIGLVGPTRCADDTAPHLHIDRGPRGQPGGGPNGRDIGIQTIINRLYEKLPD